MPRVKVPGGVKECVSTLLKLDADKLEQLVAALQKAEPARIASLIAEVVAQFDQASQPNIRKALEGLFALSLAPDELHMPLSQFVPAVVEDVFESSSPEERLGYMETLKSLLKSDDPIGIAAKAASVSREHERLFAGTRIISDMRPVFGADVEKGINAAVVVHTLRIRFVSAGTESPAEWYVSMDDDDLKSLKDEVERAEKKSRALKGFLKSSNVSYLDDN